MGRNVITTITGFVLLAAIAVAGWVRTPRPVAASAQPINCYDQNGTPVATPAMWNAGQWNAGQMTPAGMLVPAYAPGYAPAYAYAPQPVQRTVVQRPSYRTNYTPTRVVRKRPMKHSVAIVAGSAGVGAAIGALAGGGKGAGIGALSGGAAGLIYDRLTHKKTEFR